MSSLFFRSRVFATVGLAACFTLVATAQIRPTLTAIVTTLPTVTSGALSATSVPFEASATSTAATPGNQGASASVGIVDDFHLRLQNNVSSSPSEIPGAVSPVFRPSDSSARFFLAGDALRFAPSEQDVTVRLNYKLEYTNTFFASFNVSQGGSGQYQLMFLTSFDVYRANNNRAPGSQSLSLFATESYSTTPSRTVPTSQDGFMEFVIPAGGRLEMGNTTFLQTLSVVGGRRFNFNTGATVENALSANATANLWLTLEIVGTGSLSSTQSIFTSYAATSSSSPSVVPEPASFALVAGLGILGLAAGRRKGRA